MAELAQHAAEAVHGGANLVIQAPRAPLNGARSDDAIRSLPGSARGGRIRLRRRRRKCRSPGCGPLRTSSSSAASATVRVNGPKQVRPLKDSGSGQVEMRPRWGFTRRGHTRRRECAPCRAPSEPMATGTRPAATAAAPPPLDPPGVCSRCHGLRVAPNAAPSVNGYRPTSGVLVLPHDHGARRAQAAHDLAVMGLGRERTSAAERRRLASDVHIVLDGDWHPEQRLTLTRGEAPVGFRGTRACGLRAHHAKRVERAGRGVDSRERSLDQPAGTLTPRGERRNTLDQAGRRVGIGTDSAIGGGDFVQGFWRLWESRGLWEKVRSFERTRE